MLQTLADSRDAQVRGSHPRCLSNALHRRETCLSYLGFELMASGFSSSFDVDDFDIEVVCWS